MLTFVSFGRNLRCALTLERKALRHRKSNVGSQNAPKTADQISFSAVGRTHERKKSGSSTRVELLGAHGLFATFGLIKEGS